MSSSTLAVLRLRDFRFLWLTRVCAIMGLQTQAIIVGWQVYSLTRAPFMLGLTGLTEAVPAIVCALFAGHVVDISRPHRVYLVCLGVLVVNTLMLLLVAGGVVAIPHRTLLPWIFGGIFISGVARSFIMPSSFSLLPQIVPRTQIPAASACLSTGFQLAAIIGPALAGFIYGAYGAHSAWFLPVSLMTLALISLACIGMEYRHYRSEQKREPAVKSIIAGWRFIWTSRVLLPVMALDMFAVLFGGAVAMLPAYADQVLHVDARGLGLLRASTAAGALITAVLLAVRPFRQVRGLLLLCMITGFGCSMIGFGLSHVFWLSVLFLALSGAFDSVSMVIRSTLMQLLTPDAMRGRVSAVNSMFIISSNEIGAFESGLMARLLGLVPSVVLGGIGTLCVVTIVAALSPTLRQLRVNASAPVP